MPAHPKNAKSQRSLAAKKKKGGKPKVPRRSEPYEVVQFKSSLNSEIVFSHEDTKREDRENSKSEASIAIQFNEQYPVDNNRLLRISIRKEYHRKVEAALKIQKVFRGYLTRKILQKYVQNEQKLLSARIASCRSEGISEHSSYFAEKSFGDRSMGDKQLEKWGQTDRQPKEEAENGESSESDLGNE